MNNCLKFKQLSLLSLRHFSSKTHVNSLKPPGEVKVAMASDNRTFVCLHPEPTFPYEHSKPLSVESEVEESVLKANLVPEFEKKDYSDEELMRLTYTAKEFWRKDSSWKKKFDTKKAPPARDGL